MQMSKLARTRWHPLPTALLPGLKNGSSLGVPCTALSGEQCVPGEWMKTQQSHSLPPLSRAPDSFEVLLFLSAPVVLLDLTGEGEGTVWGGG